MKLLVVSAIYLFLIVTCHGSADVHTANKYIIDRANRVRFYHGVNFVRKEFPWYPSELLDPSYVTNLAQWGLNVVRLG
jgi:endoglycosylceramidase